STNPAHITQTGVHEVGARAYDSSSSSTLSAARTVLVDVTTPNIMITSPAAGPYEINSTVTPSTSCSDAGSGVQSCTGPSTVDTSTLGTHTFTVTAMDKAGNQAQGSVTYTVADRQGPTITITTPADGALYALNSTVKASYSCSDTSGVATCSGPVANGANLVTSSSGTFTFTVNATD